jgi:hypothetical protein
MTCSRCQGLLIAERVLEFYEPGPRWRCVNCGRQALPSPPLRPRLHGPRSNPRRRIITTLL